MNKEELEAFKRGKNQTQVKVIDYFTATPGCLSKVLTDEQYWELVRQRRDSMDLRTRALSKIGLDEDQVSEIPPACFEGYRYEAAFAKQTAKGEWVSSSYQVSWVFFSDAQVYLFSHTFHMDEDKKSERTDEFFYKDVTSFSTTTENEKPKTVGDTKVEVETHMFAMVVPGDKLFMSMTGCHNAEQIIQAMKQKLREKKLA